MADKRQTQRRKIVYTNAKTVAAQQKGGFTSPALKLPEGIPLFTFDKEGTYKFNIVAYIAGKGNPHADEGMIHYERTYETHRIGANNLPYCCLKQFGKKCPVCDHIVKLQRDGADEATINSMKAKRRILFLIDVLDGTKDEPNLHIFESSYWMGFGELLDAKIDAVDADDPYQSFFHLENGQTLHVKASQDTFAGRTYYKATNIEMRPRKDNYPDSLLDEVPCLDDIPVELSYKELKDILEAGGDDSDDSQSKVSSSKARGNDRDESDDDESDSDEDSEDSDDSEDSTENEETNDSELKVGDLVTYKGKECEVKKVSGDGTSLTLEDNKGKLIKAVDPDDCEKITGPEEDDEDSSDDDDLEESDSDLENDNSDDDEELPAKKSTAKSKKVEEDSDDDEDSEDDDSELEDSELDSDVEDDDEEPTPKKRGRPSKNK